MQLDRPARPQFGPDKGVKEVCEALAANIGLGGRRTVDLEHAGLRALDIYRLAQIADRLDVSIDWLLGRSKTMELREKQCQGEIG